MSTSASAMWAQLTADDKDTAERMMGVIVKALLNPRGVVVLSVDAEGNGVAEMVTAGDESRVPLLMAATGNIGEQLYGRPDAATLQ